jgi:hypothetical protein
MQGSRRSAIEGKGDFLFLFLGGKNKRTYLPSKFVCECSGWSELAKLVLFQSETGPLLEDIRASCIDREMRLILAQEKLKGRC